jgi:adenosylcobinamide-GDP ribazoletransferase
VTQSGELEPKGTSHVFPAPLVSARAAFVFMTRIPLGGFPYRPSDWQWAPAHFPLVGLVVGFLAGIPLWLLLPLGPTVAAIFSLLVSVYVTGAFHEDGLADSADALGGSHGRDNLHEILKDSRIGTYGSCALILSVLLRVSLLGEIATEGRDQALAALTMIHGLSRVGPVWLMATLPYVAGPHAKGAAVAAGAVWPRAFVASGYGLFILSAGLVFGFSSSLLVAWLTGLLLVTWAARRTFKRAAGGYAGDFLGATEQILEIALLSLFLLWLRLETFHGW